MDIGEPASYKTLTQGAPVYSSDGEQVGEVAHVLAAEDEDIFDGIVIKEHLGRGGHRFADAEQIDRIGDRGVILTLPIEASQSLPEPSANPAVVHDDPAQSPTHAVTDKLRRAWDLISGNY